MIGKKGIGVDTLLSVPPAQPSQFSDMEFIIKPPGHTSSVKVLRADGLIESEIGQRFNTSSVMKAEVTCICYDPTDEPSFSAAQGYVMGVLKAARAVQDEYVKTNVILAALIQNKVPQT